MPEYRLVVGVLGIIFDEDSETEAKQRFDLFVKQSKTGRSASGERQLRYSRIAKSSLNITLLIVSETQNGHPALCHTIVMPIGESY
jgi:hypothetical protein